jgi:poly(glycerol-phosphate) alpha-glucosyltransferase
MTHFVLMDFLDVERAGMGIASERRSSILAAAGYDTTFLTLNYQQYHPQKIEALRSLGRLGPEVNVVNFFESFRRQANDRLRADDQLESMADEPGFSAEASPREGFRAYRYFDRNGNYAKYKCFTLEGVLAFVDHRSQSQRRVRKVEYDADGLRTRETVYSEPAGGIVSQKYFDRSGACFLTELYDQSGKPSDVYFHEEKPSESSHGRSRVYSSIRELQREWVEGQLAAVPVPVVWLDFLGLLPLFKALNSDYVKILVLHNNHSTQPYLDPPPIRPIYKDIYCNGEQFAAIVFLTDEQRKDAENLYGQKKNYFVVPHAVNSGPPLDRSASAIDAAVSFARLEPQKNLKDALVAFRRVVDALPEALYHIYGYGTLRDELIRLRDSLGLDKNVHFFPFVSDVAERLPKYKLTIMTSDYEAFPLSILESLAAGVPLVSYKTKYGPEAIVRNGQDGLLVEYGDTDGLADSIVRVMQDPVLQKRMSESALEVLDRFSGDQFLQRWREVIESLTA